MTLLLLILKSDGQSPTETKRLLFIGNPVGKRRDEAPKCRRMGDT